MNDADLTRSGIYEPHARAIQETVKNYNVFLFVRPTEKESTALIELGFFTKSMDIHDKSSNWGPMAGMVPCDPYFSKKMQGAAPNPKLHPHPHGLAKPHHLQLSQEILNMLVRNVKIRASQRLWMIQRPNLVRATPGGGWGSRSCR